MCKHIPVLALLLCLCLLLSACGQSSAQEKPQEDTLPPTRLTIEDVFVPYTEAQSADFATRFTKIGHDAARLLYGVELDSDALDSLYSDLLTRRLPALQELRVTVAELSSICDGMEAALVHMAEAKDDPDAKSDAAQAFFGSALRLLGPSRMGALAYDSTLFWLDDRIAACERNYDEYGYEFFLTDAAYYRALREELTERIGVSVFKKLCSALVFASSLSGSTGGLANFLTDAEWLLLLQKQAEDMGETKITADEWQTFLTVLSELDGSLNLLARLFPAPIADELRLLLGTDARKKLSQTLPTLSALYTQTVNLMTSADLRVFRTGTREARIGRLCELLLREESTLPRLLETLEALSHATDAEINALKRHGLWESYLAYAATLPEVDAMTLTDALRACAGAPSAANCDALLRLAEGYLHARAPYATYILLVFEEVPA